MSEMAPAQISGKEKTAYFAQFAKSHLSAFRPHLKQGETLGKGPEIWRNVSEHCLVAGAFADILADELHLPTDQKNTVIKAALLHDWFKKHEVEDIKKSNGTLTLQAYADIRDRDAIGLRDMGISEDIIALASANIPKTESGPQNLPEKILWYVDAMLESTHAVPINMRFDIAENDPTIKDRNTAVSNLFRSQYNGKSLYEVQRALADKIGTELSERIGYTGKVADLPVYLKCILDKRMHEFQLPKPVLG